MIIKFTNLKALPVLFAVAVLALGAVAGLALVPADDSRAAFSGRYSEKCTGWHGFGAGSPSQATAQRAFAGFWRQHTSSTKTRGCGPWAWQKVFYRSVNTPDGGLPEGNAKFGVRGKARYIALDAPPTPEQRAAAEQAASHHGPAKLVTVPALQSAIVVAVNFPYGCELRRGDADLAPYARFQVSNERILEAFFGDADHDQWGELLPGIKAIPGLGRTDGQCFAKPIVRVTPESATPRSSMFKKFLHGVDGGHRWSGQYGGRHWPNSDRRMRRARSNLQSEMARITVKTDGAITFLDLASARAGGFQKQSDPYQPNGAYVYDDSDRPRSYHAGGKRFTFRKTRFWIPMEMASVSQYSGTGSFTEPTISRISIVNGRKGANCRDTEFWKVPMRPTGKPDPYGDWSEVGALFAEDRYPLCALGYVAFWKDPADVYGDSRREQSKARTLKDYLTTTFYSGQNILYANDYAPVPTHEWQDLRFASRRAITEMGWNLP